MKPITEAAGRWFTLGFLVVAAAGCSSKDQSAKAAAEELQKSFAKADASITQEVVQAGMALQESNYVQAMLIMNRVVQEQPVNEAQKKAVDALIIQARQAIQKDPKIDGPELYKAMSDLTERVHGEN